MRLAYSAQHLAGEDRHQSIEEGGVGGWGCRMSDLNCSREGIVPLLYAFNNHDPLHHSVTFPCTLNPDIHPIFMFVEVNALQSNNTKLLSHALEINKNQWVCCIIKECQWTPCIGLDCSYKFHQWIEIFKTIHDNGSFYSWFTQNWKCTSNVVPNLDYAT